MSKRGPGNEIDLILCPFYRDLRETSIICEGIVEDSTITIRYKRKRDHELQLHEYCQRNWQCCEIAAMLRSKYEEETK